MRWWPPSIACVAICLASLGCGSRGGREEEKFLAVETATVAVPTVAIPPGWTTYSIGKSAVKVSVPPDFKKFDEPNDTLAFEPPDDSAVRLRFNDHDLFKLANVDGEEFVKSQAKAKKLSISQKNGKLAITESKTWDDKVQKLFTQHWFVGFKDRLVVASATVNEAKKKSPEVRERLDKTIPQILETLQR